MRSEPIALDQEVPNSSVRADPSGRRCFLLGSLAAGISLAAATTGCGGGGWNDDAKLRAVNATVDLDRVDLRFNDWLFARDLGYGANVSAYTSRILGSVGSAGRFAASRTGQTPTQASLPHTLAEDFATSVVLMGSQSTGLRLVAIDEDTRHPGGMGVYLRLLHAWPGAGALDVHITLAGQALAGRAPDWVLGSYGDLSQFGTPAQATRLRITPRGQPGQLLFDNLVTGFAAGDVITLVVAPSAARLAVVVLPQDAPGYVLTNAATA